MVDGSYKNIDINAQVDVWQMLHQSVFWKFL